ncbi:MAG: 50S ribosomal protein L11 methyltransferase [Pseudomonadota bacterium]
MYKVTWRGARAAMEAAATLFSEAFHSTAHAVALTRIDEPTAEGHDGEWQAEVYFEQEPEIAHYEDAIASFDQSWRDVAPGTVERLPDIDWVAHSLEGLGVVHAGRFVLYGVHDKDKLPDDDQLIPIRIDANQAFGTGHHPTTAGCLTLLDRFAGFAPKKIFDLGCGSAVLAIAASKLWNRTVLASDIDAASVAIATQNAALNESDDKVSVVEATGFDHKDIETAAPFDFIFANILAGPLKELAPQMAAHVQKNGRVMLAGLMAEQEKSVLTAYEKAGFRQINRLDHDTWPVLLLVKT